VKPNSTPSISILQDTRIVIYFAGMVQFVSESDKILTMPKEMAGIGNWYPQKLPWFHAKSS
jgi:hypothetical protein